MTTPPSTLHPPHSASVVHLVGIGGVGMSALAEALLDRGIAVTGSERFQDSGRELPAVTALRAQGVRIFPQNGSGIDADTDAVVISSAIELNNPDILAAASRGIPITHRARALADALAGEHIIAVAGTSGKSSTTAILGHILHVAGHSPSVINGAPVVNWKRPDRTGAVLKSADAGGDNDRYCVIEADESDKSLLNFTPRHALVTNASADHFPLDETNALFDEFLSRATGTVIDGRADNVLPQNITEGDWSVSFDYAGRTFTLPLPGAYNALNACHAVRVAESLGIDLGAIADALASFQGIERRMQLVGIRQKDGVRVIDEYAHNTEKIRAALHTLNARSTRTIAIWRPHGYAPLRKMFDDLVTMFTHTLRRDDLLLLLPVFDAGGTTARDIQSDQLAAALTQNGINATFLPDHAAAIHVVRDTATRGDIIATMGARDPELPETARALADA